MSATVPCQNQPASTDPPAGGDGRTRHRLASYERGDVVVLAPSGPLDRAAVERIRQVALALAARPVVIDLSDCVLTDPNALADLHDDDAGPVEVCFLSRRPTCRLLLARTGITSRFAVFGQLEDALQARALAASGYGPGWALRP